VIYQYLFAQPSDSISPLPIKPQYDDTSSSTWWDDGAWWAHDRPVGQAYDYVKVKVNQKAHADGEWMTSNAKALRTCRTFYNEASPLFHGTYMIRLWSYCDSDNDIFSWLFDIGESNRRSIRRLTILWDNNMDDDSKLRCSLRTMIEMENHIEPSQRRSSPEYKSLIKSVQRGEEKCVRLITQTLSLLESNRDLISLTLSVPEMYSARIWDIPEDATMILKNSLKNVHACILRAVGRLTIAKRLKVGFVNDGGLIEKLGDKALAEVTVVRFDDNQLA